MTTPAFIIDETRLRRNCETLLGVKRRTGCKILLAQKAYSAYATYPIIAEYLDGTTASGLYEARLGKEKFGGETHVYNPAYKPCDFDALIGLADISCSTAQVRCGNTRSARKARAKAWDCESIPNAPRKAGTRYTTRARRTRGWA